MHDFTLHELQCFDAVVRHTGFQAAAASLHRSHPAVFAAVAKLEKAVGFALFDRAGYRVSLTDAGRAFHRKAAAILHDAENLRRQAARLAAGEESELRVIIGDICPLPPVLRTLSLFFTERPATRLHLSFESVGGPSERMLDDEADLLVHGIAKSDPRFEWIDLGTVEFIPVVAARFLPFPATDRLRPSALRDFTQCVIRDSARHSPQRDYFLLDGAHQCLVPNQLMKKELILQGLAWGHLPRFMIEDELSAGTLVSIVGKYLPGSREELVAARRADRFHGPVAQDLWAHLQRAAPLL